MYAHELIGKKAIRKAPARWEKSQNSLMGGIRVVTQEDYSYTNSPLLILAATGSHIVYKRCDWDEKILGAEPHILDCRWVDDQWINYDDLLKLASPEHQQLMSGIWSDKLEAEKNLDNLKVG